jgi:hypothetical protein
MFFFAWAIGEGFIIWRWVRAGAPPTPGALLLPSGLFLGLAILAEYQPIHGVVTMFAFALDVAVALQIVGKSPGQVTGWPPPMINDPTVILPGQSTTATAELTAYQAGGTAGQPSASVTNPTTGGGTGAGGTGGGSGLVLE